MTHYALCIRYASIVPPSLCIHHASIIMHYALNKAYRIGCVYLDHTRHIETLKSSRFSCYSAEKYITLQSETMYTKETAIYTKTSMLSGCLQLHFQHITQITDNHIFEYCSRKNLCNFVWVIPLKTD